MYQCSACKKFMGSKGGVVCPKCKSRSHNDCVRVPVGVTVADTWRCGECQSKAPKGRDPSTPIRGLQDSYLTSEPSLCETTAATSVSVIDNKVDVEMIRAMREEMRSEFSKMHDLMKNEFKSSNENMSTVSEEMRDLKKEMCATRLSFNERMDAFEARIVTLELACDTTPPSRDVSSLQQALTEVKMQLNDREQDYLLNDVLITGVPEVKGENPVHLALLLSSKMGMELDERDIVLAEREGAPRRQREDSQAPVRSRRIAVRFARRATRDSYLQAARVRRGLTTTDLGVDGAAVRIYINERLTRINNQLFMKAREECRQRKWKYCWSREGRIYVRKEHGASFSRIRHESDIDRIFALGLV